MINISNEREKQQQTAVFSFGKRRKGMKKKWMSGTLALLLAGTTVASMMPAVPVQAAGADGTGTTYYVDSKGGNDNNDGTSESKAFQTLDKVTGSGTG